MLPTLDPLSCKTTLPGRADLVDILEQCGREGLERLAPALGFKPRPEKTQKKKTTGTGGSQDVPDIAPAPEERQPQLAFTCVTSYTPRKPDTKASTRPRWFNEAGSLKQEDYLPDTSQKPPPRLPLAPWTRLWPFLHAAVGTMRRSREPDLQKIIDRAARGAVLRRIPWQRRNGWAAVCHILVDFDLHLLPYRQDFVLLCEQLQKLRGRSGFRVYVFEQGVNSECISWRDKDSPASPYPIPEPGTPVLILSDLGCLDDHGKRRGDWLSFGRRLRRAGLTPIALMPCPPRLWTRELNSLFYPVCWDGNRHFPSRFNGAAPVVSDTGDTVRKNDQAVKRLLALLSPAIRIEPRLLRAVRTMLPANEYDVGCEAEVWNHDDVGRSPCFCYLSGQQAVQSYRDAFRSECSRDKQLGQRVAAQINAHHAHLHPGVRVEEGYILADLANQPLDRSEPFMRRMVNTLHHGGSELMRDWLAWLGDRQHREIWNHQPLAAAWVKVHEKELNRIQQPPGLDLTSVAWVLAANSHPRQINILQHGTRLLVDFLPPGPQAEQQDWNDRGSPLTTLTVTTPVLQWQPAGSHNGLHSLSLEDAGQDGLLLAQKQGINIITDHEQITVDLITRPAWASAMGRDQYGLWAEFAVQGKKGTVVQRMRWIPPGRFLMGSPVDEPERFNDEQQHEVMIRQGFWLADTTCTQELWQAVMHDNPSRFKGEQRPVENVSWDDCRDFIKRLNRSRPGLELRLPSEAEWEYGCRAGTTTPFWFGENIDPGLVNYAGTSPYNDGRKGEYRWETVKVKELPCNGWGLFQMHGNVDEWVEDDWHGDSSGAPTDGNAWVDSPRGEDRVVRGGSWDVGVWWCHSTYRYSRLPSIRDDVRGLRLARSGK